MDVHDLLSGELIAFIVLTVGFSSLVIWQAKAERIRDEKRQAAWAVMARPLGLTYKKGDLIGECEGLSVRIRPEAGSSMGEMRKHEAVYVVRVAVPTRLPRDFIAAPRKWASLSERMMTLNVFKAGEPVLDEAYIFQCGAPEAGLKLVQDPDVQRALHGLVSPGADSVSFVQGNEVGVAYRAHTFVEDAGGVHRTLALLVRAAHALAKAQERLRSVA